MIRKILAIALFAPALAFGLRTATSGGDGASPRPGAPLPGAPVPGVPMAPVDDNAGERALDEAARWIAKGETPPSRLVNLHCDLDYVYDDGSTHDERKMELWFRNPDAFRANTQYQGRETTLMLVQEAGVMIRDRIRVTDLSNSPTMKELMPMLRNYRAVLEQVGRLMTPAALKSNGARFRFEGTIQDARATGGMWFKVTRNAPGEGNITFFFGSAPRKDGTGVRAIAPDRLIMAGPPGSNYAGDEYRLEDWLHTGAEAQREQFRYPRRIRLYAIGIDPENKPTMRANISFLEINTNLDPELFRNPLK